MKRQNLFGRRMLHWSAALIFVVTVARSVVSSGQDIAVPPPSFPAPAASSEVIDPLAARAAEDFSALEQGPIHEAFAELVTLEQHNGMVAPKAPPAAINEIPPEVRPEGARVEWFPGYWAWSDELTDFIWVSGVWRDVPPGQQFVPGYWNETTDGFVWVSGFWTAEASEEFSYLPQPPTTLEIAPTYPQPAPDYFWVPGCWQYRNTTYVWQAGFWNQGYSNWVWIPNRHRWTPRGWVYLPGYWDYPMALRGCLFAPVYFNRPAYLTIGYRYTPYRWVNTSILFSRLYLAPSRGHYYFGNFSSARWLSQGYRPWINVHQIRGGYDPFFAYHSWHEGQRNNPNWVNNYRNDFSRLEASGPGSPFHVQSVGSGRDNHGGVANNFSHELLHDLRDGNPSRNFVQLTNHQRDEAVLGRVAAFNTLRDQRVAVESVHRFDGHSADGRGIDGRGRSQPNVGDGPQLPGLGGQLGGGRSGPMDEVRGRIINGSPLQNSNGNGVQSVPNGLATEERGSFRIPTAARETLNRHMAPNTEVRGLQNRAVDGGVVEGRSGAGRSLEGRDGEGRPVGSSTIGNASPRDLNLPTGGNPLGNQPRGVNSGNGLDLRSQAGQPSMGRPTLGVDGANPGGATSRSRTGDAPNFSRPNNPGVTSQQSSPVTNPVPGRTGDFQQNVPRGGNSVPTFRPPVGQFNPDQPSLGQPNLGQPNLGQPNMGQQNSGQPNLGQRNFSQPNGGQPRTIQPSQTPAYRSENRGIQPQPQSPPQPQIRGGSQPSFQPRSGDGGSSFSAPRPSGNGQGGGSPPNGGSFRGGNPGGNTGGGGGGNAGGGRGGRGR